MNITEDDIPGTVLKEPLENATVPALKWWILCRGIQASSSWKKPKLIETVRKLKSENAPVVDVDGSYLYRKQEASGATSVDTSVLPEPPLLGWEVVEGPSADAAKHIPSVTHGLLYTYLADCSGASGRGEAFRALQRGFIHWSSGRLSKLEINYRHPRFCHVRCQMTPSMKQGLYRVYMLLGRISEFASILAATCECAAGKSASCTHVSALLHCLASLSPSSSQPESIESDDEDGDSKVLPITSFLCQWKAPKKRKETNLQISKTSFQKHVYGTQQKHERKDLEDFDPRPPELRGKVTERLTNFLEKVQGQDLGVSVLFDEKCRCWSGNAQTPLSPVLPTKAELQEKVKEFKKTLQVTPQKIREIEQSTRDQSKNPLWYSVRQYRLTASLFGAVHRRLLSTPPQSLVLQIIKGSNFSSASTDWGKQQEPFAFSRYVEVQEESGHQSIFACQCGFMIDELYPFLGASPDGVVHDPSSSNPFGLLEIKCPYSTRSKTPLEAAASSSFFCKLVDGKDELQLKQSHPYFCQVQGQMAISQRLWCDFVVYTSKGISIERIDFDPDFWNSSLLPKLIEFYDSCLAPEIVSPVHYLGIPVRNLCNM